MSNALAPAGDRDRPSSAVTIAAFGAIYLIWGSTFLVIRFAIETIPPLLMAGSRFLSAGAILYAWARLTGSPPPERRHWPPAVLVGSLLFLLGNGGVTWSEKRVPSGLVALIIATIPLSMSLIDWIWHDGRRPSRWMLAGLLLGFSGILILVEPGEVGGKVQVSPLNLLILLATSACWAAGSLYARSAPLPRSSSLAVAMELLAGGALLVVAGLAVGEGALFHAAELTLRSILSVAYLSLFGSVLAFTAYIWLLKSTSAARVATYAYVNPVVALTLGWVFGGEPLTGRTVAAGLVIVAAVVIITAEGSRPRPATS
jgi:drug/metabolite transporter (DMT)-like permease